MKKVTKILSVVLVLALVLTMSVVLFACNKPNDSNTPAKTPLETPINFTLKVTEWNGASLLNKEVSLQYAEDSAFDVLVDVADVVYSESEYGPFISQINNNVLFPEWSLLLYQNNKLAATGIDSLEIKEGDVVEFKNEYYPYVYAEVKDENQLLIEKSLIKYYTETMVTKYPTQAYVGDFYDDSAVIALNKNGASIKYQLNQGAIDAFRSKDLTKLEGAEKGKYYWFMKSQGMDMASFETAYSTFYNAQTAEYKFLAWNNSVYELAPAIALGLQNEVLANKISALSVNIKADQFGYYDGSLMEAYMISLYRKLTANELDAIKAINIDNYNTNAYILAVLAANGETSPALLEYFAGMINTKTFVFESPIKNDTMVNQAYWGLLANKLARMQQDKTFNILAQ